MKKKQNNVAYAKAVLIAIQEHGIQDLFRIHPKGIYTNLKIIGYSPYTYK